MDRGPGPIFKGLLTAIYGQTARVWDTPVTVEG